MALASDSIERLQLGTVRERSAIPQKVHEALHFLEMPQLHKRIDREVSVTQPTIAIIPASPAFGSLGNRCRCRCDNGPRVFEDMKLEHQCRANNGILVFGRDVAVAHPSLP